MHLKHCLAVCDQKFASRLCKGHGCRERNIFLYAVCLKCGNADLSEDKEGLAGQAKLVCSIINSLITQ